MIVGPNIDWSAAARRFAATIDFLGSQHIQTDSSPSWRPLAIANEVMFVFRSTSQAPRHPRDSKLAGELTALAASTDVAAAFTELSDYTKQLLQSLTGPSYDSLPALDLNDKVTLRHLARVIPLAAEGARDWQRSNRDTRGGVVADPRIQRIVGRLVGIYTRRTGLRPTHNEPPDRAKGSPFDQFVGEAFRCFWWDGPPPWGAIDEAIRRLIGRRSRSRRAYAPPKQKKIRKKQPRTKTRAKC